MKKVLFVSAIMCMAMAAFVACNKNDGNDPEGEGGGNGGNGGGSGTCVCTSTYMGVSASEDVPLSGSGYSSCAALGNAMQAVAPEGVAMSCRNK